MVKLNYGKSVALSLIFFFIILGIINLPNINYLLNESENNISFIGEKSAIQVRDSANNTQDIVTITSSPPDQQKVRAGYGLKVREVSTETAPLPMDMYDEEGSFVMEVAKINIYYAFGLVDEDGNVEFETTLVFTHDMSNQQYNEVFTHNFTKDVSDISLLVYSSVVYTYVQGIKVIVYDGDGNDMTLLTITRGTTWNEDLLQFEIISPNSFIPYLTVYYFNQGLWYTGLIVITGVILVAVTVNLLSQKLNKIHD